MVEPVLEVNSENVVHCIEGLSKYIFILSRMCLRWVLGLFPGVKWLWRGFDHPPLSDAEIEYE